MRYKDFSNSKNDKDIFKSWFMIDLLWYCVCVCLNSKPIKPKTKNLFTIDSIRLKPLIQLN